MWEQARVYADEINQTNADTPPDRGGGWVEVVSHGALTRDHILTYVLAGLHKAALKPVN